MKKERNSTYNIASFLILIGVMITTFIYIKNHMYLRLNSDDSSELMLAKLLASENSLLTRSWYYSTELKVFNTNLIYPLIFKFTNNFFTVRMVSYLIMWVILLLAYLLLCKVLKIERNAIISASLLFVVFSDQYYSYVLSTSHYLPFILISFLTIVLLELYLNKKKNIYLILSTVLALLAGLGGPRQMIVTYLPLFIASFIDLLLSKKKEYSFITYTLITLIACGIGYIINSKVLSQIYTFKNYSTIGINKNFLRWPIKHIVANLFYCFKGLLHVFGVLTDRISFLSIIMSIVGIIWIALTFYALYYSFKHKDKVSPALFRLAAYIFVAYFIFVSIYIFTSMGYADRYLLPISVLSIPLITLFLQEVKLKHFKTNCYLIFVILVLIQGCSYLYEFKDVGRNSDTKEILEFLNENGYQNGYATFWNGNIYTELSNGAINVWVWCDDHIERVDDVNTTYKWLQYKNHDNTTPLGKIFILLSLQEYQDTIFKDKLDKEEPIYISDKHIIFGFDSYEDLCLCLE